MTDDYTADDLQQLSDGWRKIIHDRQIRHMEQIGADIYFHVLDTPPPKPTP